MSRAAVRRLFVGVIIGLLLQYGIVGLVGLYAAELWPAIVLPAFKSVYDQSGVIESHNHRIEVEFSDGERVSFGRSEFMTFMPIIHQSVFLDKQCQPASLSGTEKTEVCQQSDGARLFIDRARELVPDRDLWAVDVIWKRLRFDMTTHTSTGSPVDTLRLWP